MKTWNELCREARARVPEIDCEGLRAALTPDLPHMPAWAFLGALTAATLLLGTIGVRAFVRRTIS